MKKTILTIILMIALTAGICASEKEFAKDRQFLTAQIGFNSRAIPFGLSYEYAVTENIGLGGTVMFQTWSEKEGSFSASQTLISPSVEGIYHFTKVKAAKFDFFAGASIGFNIYSSKIDTGYASFSGTGSSGLNLTPFAGGRYFFSKKTAAEFKLYMSLIGDWTGFSATGGVTFRIK